MRITIAIVRALATFTYLEVVFIITALLRWPSAEESYFKKRGAETAIKVLWRLRKLQNPQETANQIIFQATQNQLTAQDVIGLMTKTNEELANLLEEQVLLLVEER
jgi:hypothetical protein